MRCLTVFHYAVRVTDMSLKYVDLHLLGDSRDTVILSYDQFLFNSHLSYQLLQETTRVCQRISSRQKASCHGDCYDRQATLRLTVLEESHSGWSVDTGGYREIHRQGMPGTYEYTVFFRFAFTPEQSISTFQKVIRVC